MYISETLKHIGSPLVNGMQPPARQRLESENHENHEKLI